MFVCFALILSIALLIKWHCRINENRLSSININININRKKKIKKI